MRLSGIADSRPLACYGELGLTGELRTVAHGDRRKAEAQRFGLDPVLSPESHGTLREAVGAAVSGEKAARPGLREGEMAA
jgi:DNA repair protein RadA/Sms